MNVLQRICCAMRGRDLAKQVKECMELLYLLLIRGKDAGRERERERHH